MSTVGRRVVTWNAIGQKMRLALFDPWASKTLWQRDFHRQAQPWLIDLRRAAFCDPEGRLTVVALETGKTLLETQLGPIESLEGIVMLPSAQRYVLIANQARGGNVIVNHSQNAAIPVHGQVYGLDRRTGQKIWSVEVKDQAMIYGQPSELPLLTFGGRIQVHEQNRYKTVSKLMCLDVRNGEILHAEESSDSRIASYQVQADLEKATIEVKTPGKTITLTFTDKPADAPEDAEPTEAEPPEAPGPSDPDVLPPTAEVPTDDAAN
jgi:hypothetical protein